MSTQPARKRRRDDDRNDLPTSFLPTQNPAAAKAYVYGLIGLIPVAGLIFGPMALVQSYRGHRWRKQNPQADGGPHIIAGAVLGTAEIIINLVGLTMIAFGIGWLNPG